MIKYSDASNLEKVASRDCSSSSPMKGCCYELAMASKEGDHTCECGNVISVTEEKLH
jgi:hypothetical protein